MKNKLALLLPLLLPTPAAAQPLDQAVVGTISGFECGDNCYLTIVTSDTTQLTGMVPAGPSACRPARAAAALTSSTLTAGPNSRTPTPPGYQRRSPIRRPKLDEFVTTIDHWLEEDLKVPRKQHHTAKRVFDRLRDECGFTGGYTIIKDYMRDRDQRRQEVFVPLAHPPGHAQADFGEAMNGVTP